MVVAADERRDERTTSPNEESQLQSSKSFGIIDPELLAHTLDHMPNAAIAIEVETFEVVAFNRQLCKLLGYSPEEFAETPLERVATDGAQCRESIHDRFRARFGSRNRKSRFQLLRKDGTQIVTEAAFGDELSNDGKICAIVILTDLTEILASQEVLRENERLLNEAQELAEIGSWSWDIETNEQIWTKQLEVLCQRTANDIPPGREGIALLLHPDDRVAFLQELDVKRTSGTYKGSRYVRIGMPDDSYQHFECNYTILRDSTGKAIRTHGTAARRREDKQRQELLDTLASAQRFDAVGRLAREIAHDLNNVLGAIINYASIVRIGRKDLAARGALMEGILFSVDRARALVEGNLQLPIPDATRKTISMTHALNDMLPLIQANLTPEVEVTIDSRPGNDSIGILRSDFERIVINLVANALDALPDGGEIRLVVQPKPPRSEGDRPEGRPVDPGDTGAVNLIVEDSGRGIPDTIRDRIFEPYFSTKSSDMGRARGLGLHIVNDILRKNRGQIELTASADRGARFVVSLPMSANEDKPSQVVAPPRPARNRRVILLVDDDDDFRRSGELLLTAMGHGVIAVDDPGTVEAQLSAHPEIELLITDLTMPGLSGIELAEAIRRIRPDLRIFLCTGFSTTTLRTDVDRLSFERVLRKPWNLTELREALDNG